MRAIRFACLVALLLTTLVSCRRERDSQLRIKILDNPWVRAASRPVLLAEHLNNPMSPRQVGGKVVFAESGSGTIRVAEKNQTRPLITGFAIEQYDGFNISVEGVTVDPVSGLWIVAAAEGPGRVQLFDPTTFPTSAANGRNVPLEGATDDNPFATVLADRGRILVVSGGTKTAYQGKFDPAESQNSVKAAFEVKTGLIGLAIDPKTGDVFGAIFGGAPRSAEIIRWDARKEPVIPKIVASGLTNAVDVAFTVDGLLLALEFGGLGEKGQGRVSIVATDGSGAVTPFITGLNNPSGFSVDSDNTLYISEFGESVNEGGGTLVSVKLASAQGK